MAVEHEIDRALERELRADEQPVDRIGFDFALARRRFVQMLGAGLMIAVGEVPAAGQRAGGRRRGGRDDTPIASRLHIGADGGITLLSGKVECGQGARAELSQAAAEELRVPVDRVSVVLADTASTPNDGITAGSRSTPSTVPAVRRAAAAARQLLVEGACRRWSVPAAEVEVRDGRAIHAPTRRERSYADLAGDEEAAEALRQTAADDVTVTPVGQWRVLGTSTLRPNGRDLVTGAHRYPSDIVRPGMLHGKVLRPPSYGARLISIDTAEARAMEGVTVVEDGPFIGVAAPTALLAARALQTIASKAEWEPAPHPSSEELYEHLRRHAQDDAPADAFAEEPARAAGILRRTYHVAYVQHAPMEPRAAVAEWNDGGLTVWTATQNPFGVRSELARAFRLDEERVRIIVPDFGGGFGGKHSGETAVEAARLAREASRPVSLRWTREEEFTWAYFRPAAVIDAEAALDGGGAIRRWRFVNINSGGSAIETPYRVGGAESRFVRSDPPLRHGSYRALAATANNFARECFMDELAEAAGEDALAFRLAHLGNRRLRAVLEEAAGRFDWSGRLERKEPDIGIGLACGTEKGSYVAACVEVAVDRSRGRIAVRRVCQAFECGAILNPRNLLAQVQGCIIMGLGPALREEMRFEGGLMLNAAFARYRVPRFEDVPELDIHLLDRPDLPSVGAGETPIIAVAPAIANAVYRATGRRVHQMPIRLPAAG